MKKLNLLISMLAMTFCLAAQQGKVFDNLSMESKILDMERKYATIPIMT